MFNDWLLSELRKKEWDQADLARASGLTTAAISKYIGGRVPNSEALQKIAHALKLPPELVFEKAGLLPPKSELSPKKRELMEKLQHSTDADAQFVIDMLEVAVKNRQRQVPDGINPKTTPR